MQNQRITVKSMIENLQDHFETNGYGHKAILIKTPINGMKVFTKSSLERNKQLCIDVHDRFCEEMFDEIEERELQEEQDNMELLAEEHYWAQHGIHLQEEEDN